MREEDSTATRGSGNNREPVLRRKGGSAKGGVKGGGKGNKSGKGGKHRPNTLDSLKQRMSALMAVYDANGLFLPPPDMAKGKTWSSRIYGQVMAPTTPFEPPCTPPPSPPSGHPRTLLATLAPPPPLPPCASIIGQED
jgi:hypothetical protein